MNNSLPRLYEGMAASLSERILPHIADDFARGQAYGLIYLLRCLSQRTGWSDDYLAPQWEALREVAGALSSALQSTDDPPSLHLDGLSALPLQARCEQARTAVCEAYDRAERHADALGADRLATVRTAWQAFIARDLKLELSFRERLPYSEMSTGYPASTPEAAS